MSDILDYRLQHWLRKFISTLPYSERVQLKNIAHCNERIIADRPVFLLSNKKSALFFGQATCKNTFACPCCTARVMSKYRGKISSAIEALNKSFYPLMITFAMPHLAFMSCKETVDILYESWRRMSINKGSIRYTKTGEIRWNNDFNKFWVLSGIKYLIRASEFTHGRDGWNPHFHMLFFVPRDKKDLVYTFESDLEKLWIKILERETLKYWQKNNLHGDEENQKKLLQRVFWARNKGYSVKFSKQETKSGDYLSGWSSDSELTQTKYKTAQEGHLNPYQMLEKAASGDEECAELYREFMLNVTRKPVHRRVEFSKGLHQIIAAYRNTEGFKEVLKKKKQTENWAVVCWFQPDMWYKLCELDYQMPIFSNILWLAVNAPDLLFDFLSFFGISVEISRHLWTEHVEKVLNCA